MQYRDKFRVFNNRKYIKHEFFNTVNYITHLMLEGFTEWKL